MTKQLRLDADCQPWYGDHTRNTVTVPLVIILLGIAQVSDIKRIYRDRRLTAEEAEKYQAIRAQIVEEMPELIARHHRRVKILDKGGEQTNDNSDGKQLRINPR